MKGNDKKKRPQQLGFEPVTAPGGQVMMLAQLLATLKVCCLIASTPALLQMKCIINKHSLPFLQICSSACLAD